MTRTGRRPIYTDAVAEAFLQRVERGERIKQICAEDGMPSWTTVSSWLRNRPTFAMQYARARQASAEALEHEALEQSYLANDKDSAAAARVRVETLKWAAAKRNPRLYADKLLHTGGDGEGPIAHKVAQDYSLLTGPEMAQLLALIEKATPKHQRQQLEGPVIEGEVEEGE